MRRGQVPSAIVLTTTAMIAAAVFMSLNLLLASLLLGIRTDRTEVLLQPHGTSVLLVGSSGSGKSRLAAGGSNG